MRSLSVTALVSESDADPERVDNLSTSLRRELLELPDVSVDRRRVGVAPPPGSRGVDAAALGALVLAMSSSSLALAQTVGAVRGWLARSSKDCSVELTAGSESIKISGARTAEQDELIEEFIHKVLDSGG